MKNADISTQQPDDIALYIHWPFCQSKCPYCDFNSHVRTHVDQDIWEKALLSELNNTITQLGERQLKSIFFGGGTPSLMSPDIAATLIETAQNAWNKANKEIEITLEANPTSVDVGRFHGYRQAGVNRLSIGVQSFDPEILKFLGRLHNDKQAYHAIETARDIFDKYSFDLIYARPNQTTQQWRNELKEALSLSGGHLSLYQLTIEPGTAFHTQYRLGAFKLPDEDAAAELYEITQEIMHDAQMPAYEVSYHAKIGHESAHNLTYWRYRDYAGIGPGAHGRVTIDGQKYAQFRHRLPEKWLDTVDQNSHGTKENLIVADYEQFQESLLMGLRIKEGVSLDKLSHMGDFLNLERVRTLQEEGLILMKQNRLYATKDGIQRLNAVLDYLMNE